MAEEFAHGRPQQIRLDCTLWRSLQKTIYRFKIGWRSQQDSLGKRFSGETFNDAFEGNIRKCVGKVRNRDRVIAVA